MDGVDDYLDLIASWTYIVFLFQKDIQKIDQDFGKNRYLWCACEIQKRDGLSLYDKIQGFAFSCQ